MDKIAFTGDTATGREIMQGGADTLKRLTLELGGKSPNIVFPDADIEAAVRGASTGIFYGKGEVCAAGSRLLVDWSIRDEFLDKLVARTKKIVARRSARSKDPPRAPSRRRGNSNACCVRGHRQERRRDPASPAARAPTSGQARASSWSRPCSPDVTPAMTIAREEIFGPVLAAIEFADVDEAIARANDSIYGLAAAVWTRDIKKAHYVARRLQAGTVWVNTYNVYDTALPFGGYKQSGFGREMGMHALEHYTQTKSVFVDLNQ